MSEHLKPGLTSKTRALVWVRLIVCSEHFARTALTLGRSKHSRAVCSSHTEHAHIGGGNGGKSSSRRCTSPCSTYKTRTCYTCIRIDWCTMWGASKPPQRSSLVYTTHAYVENCIFMRTTTDIPHSSIQHMQHTTTTQRHTYPHPHLSCVVSWSDGAHTAQTRHAHIFWARVSWKSPWQRSVLLMKDR